MICTCMIWAQKIKFSSINQFGWLSGGSQGSWQLQSVNGIRYKMYAAGLGVGVDHYYFRSFPVFVDLRAKFFDKKQAPFFYTSLGTNFPSERKGIPNGWQNATYDRGFYLDAGLGYAWPVKGRFAFVASAGFSLKKLEETRTSMLDPGFSPPEYYHYTLNRISIKAGLRF